LKLALITKRAIWLHFVYAGFQFFEEVPAVGSDVGLAAESREQQGSRKMDEQFLRQQLTRQYQYLAETRLNELASGNISVRFGEGMLISPTGATGSTIAPEEFVAMDLKGQWQGQRAPSSEWRMHAEIYQVHEIANAVVHTHSDYCVALACRNRPLPGFHYLVGSFGGADVPCVPYSTFGTEELASSAAAALASRNTCLLGNHGMICRGDTLEQAVMLAHRLEIMCRQYLLACQLGEPDCLTDDQWRDFFAQASNYNLL
jgi:L-fuculose-phosphate aldolase